jgi:hypothetical protein
VLDRKQTWRSPLQDRPASLPGCAPEPRIRADHARIPNRPQHGRIGVGVSVEIAIAEIEATLAGPRLRPLHFARPVAKRMLKSSEELALVIDREVVRQEVVELPGVPRRPRGKRRGTRQKDELVPAFAMLVKRGASAGTKMVGYVPGKPVARLLLEILIGAPLIVTHGFLKRGLDINERQMVEDVPDDDPAKLPQRDAPTAKLVLGPQRRAVHIEQRAVEVEEGGGSRVQVVAPGLPVQRIHVLWGLVPFQRAFMLSG